jgi:hypothetical protein
MIAEAKRTFRNNGDDVDFIIIGFEKPVPQFTMIDDPC